MTGSGPAVILIPIAGTIFLAMWLILVFLAGSQSRHARHESAPGRNSPGTAALADRGQHHAWPVDAADLAGTVPYQGAPTGTLPTPEGARLLRHPAESGYAVSDGPAKPAA